MTSESEAKRIRSTGRLTSHLPSGEVYFTSSPTTLHSTVFCGGPSIVECEVPKGIARIEDEFPDGERHFTVRARDVRYVVILPHEHT